MERQVLRALCTIAMAGACACGLAEGGLLDVPDSGDAGAMGDDEAPVDATTEGSLPSGDGGPGSDTLDAAEGGAVDARPETVDDAPGDAMRDAPPDTVVDAPPEGPLDGPLDSPPESTDAPQDSAPPAPLVWDGGPITDPQFYDSDWIDFCAALVGCGQLPSMSACISLLHQPSSSDVLIPPPSLVLGIENASPTCSVVEDALDNGSLCPTSTPDSCSGTFVQTCRWGFKLSVDCAGLGMTCSTGAGNPGCGFGNCNPSQEGETYCVGPNWLAKCVSGRYVPELDCQTFGGACVGPAGTAQCQGTAGPAGCTEGMSCSGTSILACMDGLFGSVDCTALFDPTFTCLTNDAGAPVCAAGTSCDPATFQDTCTAGSEVSFCNAGVTKLYDCLSNAWSGCAAGKCTP